VKVAVNLSGLGDTYPVDQAGHRRVHPAAAAPDLGGPLGDHARPALGWSCVDKQHGIPIIVGGTSPGALRRAGHLGDGWVHHTQIHASVYTGEKNPRVNDEDFAELEQHLQVIERHRQEAGRAERPFDVVASMGGSLEHVRRSRELGVTTYQAGPSAAGLRGTKDDFVDWIKRVADEVIAVA
jgi:alkanesulfonate monooxygenase SsuD/methylene tetrahydromethanopterin reductase-like flavin-dependent oxidoreductase (luciferase family)